MMNLSMQSERLRLSELPHTSRLFADFADDWNRVAGFYAHAPTLAGIREAAKKVSLDAAVRRQVADVLTEQNRTIGADAAALRNLQRLESGAMAVVTGQQVGLFGGPAFSFYKALTTVALARQLTEAGLETVPVFWLATEDHDFAEINHTDLLAVDGALHRVALQQPPGTSGQGVGQIVLGDGIAAVVGEAAAACAGSDGEEVAAALAIAYRPGERLGRAFAELMARLLAGRGLIFLDPADARLHRLSSPVFRGASELCAELSGDLQTRAMQLAKAGYHAQVKVTERSTLLFLEEDGRRHPLRRRGEEFHTAARSFSAPEVLALLQSQPELFSANVLLRPVMQDALLPTAAYVAGPAEVAYFAQCEVVYKRLGRPMPAVIPRAGFTLVEPLQQRLLKKYGLSVSDLFAGRQRVQGSMAGKSLPRELGHRFRTLGRRLEASLARLQSPLGQLDPTLRGALETAGRKMNYQLRKLRGKAARAENVRTGALARHVRILLDSLYPHNSLQERTMSLLPLLARHGMPLLDELEKQIRPENPQHHLLFL